MGKTRAPVPGVDYYYEVRKSSQDLSLGHDDDPTAGHCLMPHTLTLVAGDLGDLDAPPNMVVGSLDYYVLSQYEDWSALDYYEALDSIDSDVASFLSVLTDDDGNANPVPEHVADQFEANFMAPVALLATLTVAAPWRGRGLGAALLAHALRYHLSGYSYAVLCAVPLQFGGARPDDPAQVAKWLKAAGYADLPGTRQQATAKLQAFYKKLGFERLKRPRGGSWMALSFAYNHQKKWEKAIRQATG